MLPQFTEADIAPRPEHLELDRWPVFQATDVAITADTDLPADRLDWADLLLVNATRKVRIHGTVTNPRNGQVGRLVVPGVGAWGIEDGPEDLAGNCKIFALGTRCWIEIVSVDARFVPGAIRMHEEARIYWILRRSRERLAESIYDQVDPDGRASENDKQFQTLLRRVAGARGVHTPAKQLSEDWAEIVRWIAPDVFAASTQAEASAAGRRIAFPYAEYLINQMLWDDAELLWAQSPIFAILASAAPAVFRKLWRAHGRTPKRLLKIIKRGERYAARSSCSAATAAEAFTPEPSIPLTESTILPSVPLMEPITLTSSVAPPIETVVDVSPPESATTAHEAIEVDDYSDYDPAGVSELFVPRPVTPQLPAATMDSSTPPVAPPSRSVSTPDRSVSTPDGSRSSQGQGKNTARKSLLGTRKSLLGKRKRDSDLPQRDTACTTTMRSNSDQLALDDAAPGSAKGIFQVMMRLPYEEGVEDISLADLIRVAERDYDAGAMTRLALSDPSVVFELLARLSGTDKRSWLSRGDDPTLEAPNVHNIWRATTAYTALVQIYEQHDRDTAAEDVEAIPGAKAMTGAEVALVSGAEDLLAPLEDPEDPEDVKPLAELVSARAPVDPAAVVMPQLQYVSLPTTADEQDGMMMTEWVIADNTILIDSDEEEENAFYQFSAQVGGMPDTIVID